MSSKAIIFLDGHGDMSREFISTYRNADDGSKNSIVHLIREEETLQGEPLYGNDFRWILMEESRELYREIVYGYPGFIITKGSTCQCYLSRMGVTD